MVSEKDFEDLRTTINSMKADFTQELQKLTSRYETEVMTLKDQMRQTQDAAAGVVTEKPLMSLAVAFILGMTLGIALSKGKK
jgi:ElaB/YqjD/DUF883 family membrane-anchored ribosome-binding protein